MGQFESHTGENRENVVPGDIRIRFMVHAQETDSAGLGNMLRGASVFMPEVSSWTPEIPEVLREVSEGKTEPVVAADRFNTLALETNTYWLGRFRQLYRTGVRIEMLDAPAGHPVDNAMMALFNPLKFARFGQKRIVFSGDADQLLSEYAEYARDEEAAIRMRERYMANRICEVASRGGRVIPEAGISHFRLLDDLSVSGVTAAYVIPTGSRELIRKISADREYLQTGGARDWGFIARYALRDVVDVAYRHEMSQKGISSLSQLHWARNLMEQFTDTTVDAIWKQLLTPKNFENPPVRPVLDRYIILP